MRAETIAIACLLVLWTTASAAADQAEWVPRDVAEREVALLSRRNEVVAYCAPCGDAAARRRRYAEVRIARTEGELYEVTLDGEAIDAAYTYVEIGGVFRNLALAVGFEVMGVPEVLAASQVSATNERAAPRDIRSAPGLWHELVRGG